MQVHNFWVRPNATAQRLRSIKNAVDIFAYINGLSVKTVYRTFFTAIGYRLFSFFKKETKTVCGADGKGQ